MGREIVYCDSCGERILETEFEKGRAVTVHDKRYCFLCKDQVQQELRADTTSRKTGPFAAARSGPTAPGKQRQHSSARIPLAPRPAKIGASMVIGVIIACVALGVLVWFMMPPASTDPGVSKPPPPPPGKPAPPATGDLPERRALETMKALEVLVLSIDTRYADVLAAVERAKAIVAGTKHAARVEEIAVEANRVKDRLEGQNRFDLAIQEVRRVQAGDGAFLKHEEVLRLVADAKAIAAKVSPELAAEGAKIEQDAITAFDTYAAKLAEEARVSADAYAKAGRYADAIDTIERGFPTHLRKTKYWAELERIVQAYRNPTQQPPAPQFPTEPMPPAGKPYPLFDGGDLSRFYRHTIQGEKQESWTVEAGVIVGTSSWAKGDKAEVPGDAIVTRAAEFADFELELEVKVESGGFYVGARVDLEQNTAGGIAGIGPLAAADWTKLTLKWSKGKLTFQRPGGPPQEVGVRPVAKGRIVFGLIPGTVARLRNVMITPLAE